MTDYIFTVAYKNVHKFISKDENTPDKEMFERTFGHLDYDYDVIMEPNKMQLAKVNGDHSLMSDGTFKLIFHDEEQIVLFKMSTNLTEIN